MLLYGHHHNVYALKGSLLMISSQEHSHIVIFLMRFDDPAHLNG